jgi:tetratricopeptide (TPR) repeat protein
MDTVQTLIDLTQDNLPHILTVLWLIWIIGMALGVVIFNVSRMLDRRTLSRFDGGYRGKERPDLNTLQFEVDQGRLQDILSRREAELREDAKRMGLDFELQAVLKNFRDRIQKKLADLPNTYLELLNRLQYIFQTMNDFKELFDTDQFFMARIALKRYETIKAANLLKQARFLISQQIAEASGSPLVVARGRRLAAQATFLLGQLAEADFNYFMATQYYQQAAYFQPGNVTYLNTAAELSYAFGEFNETEHLLKQVLKIQEKLLGPEHPDLAQTLNNLGVLRHTQGRYAEAEAFYLWALEICEVHQDSQDHEVVNLRQNYEAFLYEMGRLLQAKRLKVKTALA